MAGYPVFQPQAPNIDISLFGDAAKAGTQVGSAIPSAITSIVSGAEQGIKFASDIQAEDARTNLTEIQAKNAQLELERNQANQDAQLKADTANLTLQTDKAQQADQRISAENQFYDQVSKTDLNGRYALLTSGNPVLSQNPELFKNNLQQLSLMMPQDDPRLPQVNRLLGHTSLDAEYQKNAIEDQRKFETAKAEALQGDGKRITDQIVNSMHVQAEAAPSVVDMLDRRTVTIEDGFVKKKEGGKGYEINSTPSVDDKAIINPYIAVSNQPGSEGQVVMEGISQREAETYPGYRAALSRVTGQQLQYAKRMFDANLQRQSGQGQQNTDTNVSTFNDNKGFGTPSTGIKEKDITPKAEPTTPVDIFRSKIQDQLGITDDDTKDVRPLFNRLYALSNEYAVNPTTRVVNNAEYVQTMKGISRSISDKQFNSNPGVQALFTTSHVEANNDLLGAKARKYDPYDEYSLNELYSTQKVTSPEDLYYNNFGIPIYNKLADFIISSNQEAWQQNAFNAKTPAALQNTNKGLIDLSKSSNLPFSSQDVNEGLNQVPFQSGAPRG